MADKHKALENLVGEDVVGAILAYEEMTVRDRVEALWYLIDHADLNEKCMRMMLTENFTPMLECMREANKLQTLGGGYDDDWVNDKAAELYLKKFPEEAEKDELPEEIKEEKKNKFYTLL